MAKRIVVSMLLGICIAAFAATVSAEEAKFELKAGMTMREALAEYTGKRVALRLASGDEIEGTVTMVGNSLAHISKLSGKEFYDAVVSIDKISAVRTKMRDK